MILRPSLRQFLLTVFIYNSVTAAWPWPPSFPDIEGLILRRDDKTSSSSEAKPTAAQTTDSQSTASPASKSASGTAAATSTSDDDAKTTGKKPSATASTSGSKPKATTTSNGKKPQKTDVDPRLPPGGVNMVTPSALATSTYYKIGVDSPSFVWNYTSLAVTPSRIDVLVTCTGNQATYTLSSNASFEETGSVVWDTRPDMSGPTGLLTEMYTLVIHDADKEPTDTAEAGHLGTFNQHIFGMYRKLEYTPRSEWRCVSCNGALSDSERQAIRFMVAMSGITILSFTWFVGGFGAVL